MNLRVALKEEQNERIELLRKFTILNSYLNKSKCMLNAVNQVKVSLKNTLNKINRQMITLNYVSEAANKYK